MTRTVRTSARLCVLAAVVTLTSGLAVAESAGAATRSQVVSRVRTEDPVVFVTIDDGSVRSKQARSAVERLRWPVTSFVVPASLERDPRYFTTFGPDARVENHTVTHRNLTRLSRSQQRREICDASRRIARKTGTRPRWLRPPYGEHNGDTALAAAQCGITHVVTWRVTVNGSNISTWGGPIRRGDIILLHFRPDLDKSIKALSEELDRLGLEPADLGDYLR